jgi:hypothetical protein
MRDIEYGSHYDLQVLRYFSMRWIFNEIKGTTFSVYVVSMSIVLVGPR